MADKAKSTEADWQRQDTIDEATAREGEWVEPAPGVELEGVLERAFAMKDENNPGQFRACYSYRDAKGDVWLFGERAAFKDAIRALRITTPIRIKFLKKVELENAKGKKTGKTPWRVEFFANPSAALPNSNTVKAELRKSYEALSSNDLPF